LIQPIDEDQRRRVVVATDHWVERARQRFGRAFEPVPVRFDLRGRSAGMFRVEGRRRWIRYNPWIFGKYFEENLHDTVPHEVAHYIVHELYGSRRVRPHGRQWQAVMAAFGLAPAVTFNLDLEGIPQRRQRLHAYHCGCRLHEVSSTRHNRVQRGESNYQCRYCDGRLRYVG